MHVLLVSFLLFLVGSASAAQVVKRDDTTTTTTTLAPTTTTTLAPTTTTTLAPTTTTTLAPTTTTTLAPTTTTLAPTTTTTLAPTTTTTLAPTTTTTLAPTTTTTTAAPTDVPNTNNGVTVTFDVPAANPNVNQSAWLANGVMLDVIVFNGLHTGQVNGESVSVNVKTFYNVSAVSGYATTSTTFTVAVTDDVTSGAITTAPNQGNFFLALSGGNIDQNSYLYVKVGNSWVEASTTCVNASRSYLKFKLQYQVCALGDFVVMRLDKTVATQCAVATNDKLIVGSYPVLDIDNTKFINNTLFTNIIGPYVSGRQYTLVTLSNAWANSSMCTMGAGVTGSFANAWTQSFSQCRDVLGLALKWTAHNNCGFLLDATSTDQQAVYKGKVILVYTDTLGTFSGVAVNRTTTHNYDIYITFQKTLIVTFAGLNVTSDVGIDVALTAEKYSAASGLLQIELTTAVVWSYRLDNTPATLVLTTPAGITGTAVSVDMSLCTGTAGSLCVQKLSFSLSLAAQNSTCTFDGQYQITASLLACPPPQVGCSSTSAPISFSLYSGPVCTSFTVKPVVTGTLQAYAVPPPFTTPLSSFKLGDQVFFAVTINAGTGNNVAIKFSSIGFDDNTGAGFKYMLSNYAQVGTYSAAALTLVEASNYFSLYLTGSVFKIAYDSQAMYTFNATMDLIFAGNKKRTAEASWEVSASKINTLTRVYITPSDDDMVWEEESEDVIVGDEQNTVVDEAASLPVVVGAVVGVVAFNVLVSMLVIAFYRKMTAQHRYSQVSTSA